MNSGAQIIEVRFLDGPLGGREPRRMANIGERLVAWEHLQAAGVVQISTPDRPERQTNLWKRHDYQRDAHGDNRADYSLVPDHHTKEAPDAKH